VNPKPKLRLGIALLACCALLVAMGGTSLRAAESEWAAALERQMQKDEACKVMYLVNVREYRLFDKDVVEARVQCEDGRSFDTVRRERQLPFEIAPCKPVAC
jgi:hypothetical protein